MLWPTSRTLVAGAVALAVGMGRVAPARADDTAERLARQRYVEGVAAQRARQWEQAWVLFRTAYKAKPHWQIAANLANVELELGKHRDAAEHATTFLRETRDDPAVDPIQRAGIERLLARARAKVGTLQVIAPYGAEVLVNGSSAGSAPLVVPVFVDPGWAVIEARLPGYTPASESRELAPGGEATVDLRLTPIPPPPADPPVVVRQSPPVVHQLPDARRGVYRGIVIGGVTLGVTAAGVGAGLGIVSILRRSASLDCEVGRCGHAVSVSDRHAEYDRLQSQQLNFARASVATLAGAGAVLAGTAIYAGVGAKTRAGARVGISVAPGAAFMSVKW